MHARAALVALLLVVVLPATAAADVGCAIVPVPGIPPCHRVFVPVADTGARAPATLPSSTPTAVRSPTPTRTPMPAATATATPRPSATAVPTATAVATATPIPNPSSRTMVIFLEGYASTGTGAIWDPVRAQLRRRGWTDDQFVSYSYGGGGLDAAGIWRPNPYSCAQTQRGVAAATDTLNAMLVQLGARYPGWRYVLAGHSLGGLTAWWQVYGAVERYTPSYGVVGAVTVDAPLLGVGAPSAHWLIDVVHPECPGFWDQTLGDFVGLDGAKDAYRARWMTDVAAAWAGGTKVVTIGNDADASYAITGNAATQYIPPYAVHFNDTGTGLDDSHSAVLRDEADFVASEVAYVASASAAR